MRYDVLTRKGEFIMQAASFSEALDIVNILYYEELEECDREGFILLVDQVVRESE